MKHVLLGTAAAVALLAAPTIAFAQDEGRSSGRSGGAQEMSQDNDPRGGDELDRASESRADRSSQSARAPGERDAGGGLDRERSSDVRGERGKEEDDRRAEHASSIRREHAAIDDRRDRDAGKDSKERFSYKRAGEDRDGRRDRADRDDRSSVSAKIKISDRDGRDRDRRDRDSRRGDRSDLNVKVSDRDRRGYDDDYGRTRAETQISSRDEMDVERRTRRTTSFDAGVERRGLIRQRFASEGSTRRVARSSLEGSDVSVGSTVPSSIVIRRVPATVVEAEPEYTTYSYFETDDDRIVIVNPESHRVVRVIED